MLKGLEKKLAKALVAPLPLEKVIAGLRQDIKTLNADKGELDIALSARGDAVEAEVAKLRSLQSEIDQLTATDLQRKQAMDELLEKMAGMAIDGQKVSAELTVTRSKLSQQIDALRGENDSSSLENKRLASIPIYSYCIIKHCTECFTPIKIRIL